jgi:hypothetical protein
MAINIKKVNNNLPRQDQINDLSDFILYLEGLVEQGKFDKNEIAQIISDLSLDRKFAYRDTGLGNTASTYTDWSHLKAETGYSIWKISPTNYIYNSNNQVYFDNKLLEPRGEADSESATTFDTVYLYDAESGGGTYNDHTTEAGTEEGTEFSLMDSTSDYLYIGEASTFAGVKFEFQTRGAGYTLKVEYYDSRSGYGWTQLTANVNDLDDDTNNLESDGKITWTIPSDWGEVAVNGTTKYWVRISTTATPTTTAKAYYIIPGDSVIGLLAMSSTQLRDEDWAWCSYGSSIYVTIRNAGDGDYEGDYYITSSSTAANLKNFFAYNHPFTADYQDNTYNPVITKTSNYTVTFNEGIILVDSSGGNVTIILPTAVGNSGKRKIIKVIDKTNTVAVDGESGETIDGATSYTFSANYDCIEVVSNGTEWFIIRKV